MMRAKINADATAAHASRTPNWVEVNRRAVLRAKAEKKSREEEAIAWLASVKARKAAK